MLGVQPSMAFNSAMACQTRIKVMRRSLDLFQKSGMRATIIFLFLGGMAGTQAKADDQLPLSNQFAEIEQQSGGRLGVAALDTGNGRRVEYRAAELEIREFMSKEIEWPAISNLNAPLFALCTKRVALFCPIPGTSAAYDDSRNVDSWRSLRRVPGPLGQSVATMAN
jgi:hypothetical protein